jgi:hypothetical protein
VHHSLALPMTKLALPLFNDDLAPRFCYADHVLVVEVSDDAVISARPVPMGRGGGSERLGYLSTLGVTDLLCGGFNRQFLPRATAVGIRVQWGLAGNALQVAEAFCCDELDRCRIRRTASAAGRVGGRREEGKDVT